MAITPLNSKSDSRSHSKLGPDYNNASWRDKYIKINLWTSIINKIYVTLGQIISLTLFLLIL